MFLPFAHKLSRLTLFTAQVSSGTFSVGIDWCYWEYYDNYDREHSYRDKGLFVEPKYNNLKEEILEYNELHIDLYHEEILPKAKKYKSSQKIRSMKTRHDYTKVYDTGKDVMIDLERLICIILYTDYTKLSSRFTSTFRKNDPFEPLQATKKRHRNYYWMAKLLKSTVESYGKTGYGNMDKETYEQVNKLLGPFFCGMNVVMNMPQFDIKLLSPTSTSVQLAVAMKFSGAAGIIIEFGNDRGWAEYVLGLDVSFISRFHEEDERYDVNRLLNFV